MTETKTTNLNSDTLLTKTSWNSSMQSIQVTPNTNNTTITLTIKNDDTHGHRTFMIARKDLPQITEMFQHLIDNPPQDISPTTTADA